jgi:HAD superfamily hydrolase (TIGR01509 family)
MKAFPTLEALLIDQPELRGVLFDMDGTLFKTEELHAEVFQKLAFEWKIQLPPSRAAIDGQLRGMSDRQVIEMARGWPGFPQHLDVEDFIQLKNQKLIEMIPHIPLETYTSVELTDFLKTAKKEKMCLGLVTSSERVVTEVFLKHTGVFDLFDLIITFQDVKNPKPHPEPYIKALTQLNLGPRETVIFEDSVPGLESAEASGCRVIKAEWWD